MKVNNSCEATCGARSSRCLSGSLLVLHGGQPAPATPICSQHPQNPSSGGIHPSSPGPLWSPYQLSQGPAPPRIFVLSFQKLLWSSRFLLFSSELVILLCNFWSKIFKRGISQKWFQINWKHSTFYSGSIANQFSVSLYTLALIRRRNWGRHKGSARYGRLWLHLPGPKTQYPTMNTGPYITYSSL